MGKQESFDVVVIGAGPSGSVSSALLNQKGYRVLVLEKSVFPRFSIGESLLPQCMQFLEQAGMLAAVQAAGFQFKNGAAFSCGQSYNFFDFTDKFSPGWGTTFQVQRDRFDQILADQAAAQGVEIRYAQTVTECDFHEHGVDLTVQDASGVPVQIGARFVLDASGFGRVLPRLLDLDLPSRFEQRRSIFTHVEDYISDERFDRQKILISVHPVHRQIWYWLIPFGNGRSSIGVVAPLATMEAMSGDSEQQLRAMLGETDLMADLLGQAEYDTQVRTIDGYSCDVKQLYGHGFALLGNAGEFLDPVFSSGVTIALKSASLVAGVLDRQLSGLNPDWDAEFAQPLKQGVDTFRAFVEGWYDGRLQDVIFATDKNDQVKRMISSILAGYAWDQENPYVKDPGRLTTLAELCRGRTHSFGV